MLHDGSLLNMDHHLHRANTPAFSFSQQTWGGWVAHVSTTRHSITYLGSTRVKGTMKKESYCKWESPFVANAASEYCMQSGFKVGSQYFWPYPTSQHQRKKKKCPHGSGIPMPGARLAGWKLSVMQPCSLRTCPETSIQRHVVISLKSKIITNIHEQRL